MGYANFSNLGYLESLYESYRADPMSVDASWRAFFEGMEFGKAAPAKAESDDLRVYHLIEAYRQYGHLLAQCNPVAVHAPKEPEELKLSSLHFQESELTQEFPTCGFLKKERAPLKEIIEALRSTYCQRIGVEYVGDPQLDAWLIKRIEPFFSLNVDKAEKMHVLQQLNKAELFESFIHTRYVGQKRFSLEGAETLIPILSAVLEMGAEEGVEEALIGMAHRGRLNVLANIMNKSYAQIFHEFEDHYTPDLTEGTGDVKYHKGFSGALKTRHGKEVLVALAANPSHLESVDPVVEGQVRAKQELKKDKGQRQAIVPILIHGDAAIAGQGVVYETLQLSQLNGYGTGGTIHIVINNQIGFTTLPKDGRSTRYCTDVARAFTAPVFHVNAEDPEGCVAVAKMAIEMRQKFHCDVFIDLNCYRKYGHNEGDEPAFTQPLEYKLIKAKKSIRELYREQLVREGVIDHTAAEKQEEEFKAHLHETLKEIPQPGQTAPKAARTLKTEEVATAVPAAILKELAEKFCAIPEGLHPHPKILKGYQERLHMVHEDNAKKTIDWGMGEMLTYASLVHEKYDVRLSGQDSRRGTFSHRHGCLVDQVEEGKKYFPLSHMEPDQGLCDIFNSPLSEYAVLGFEFGYSISHPNALVLWEAQFGDFLNGAQIIVDQYISAAEQKWGLRSNLSLLLPHGYEGQGPEHSSGRMERFLQLCGEENMQVVNCTSPAQFFHLLRRQVLRPVKKPLILFTPKSALRHPQNVSSLNEFTTGTFQEVIAEEGSAKKLIFCSGKVYYDLFAEREKRKIKECALIRVEQLYPFPKKRIKEIVNAYKEAKEYLWVQEEHSNMGAWEFVQPLFDELLGKIRYVGRGRSASPAAGSYALHKKQLATIMDEVWS